MDKVAPLTNTHGGREKSIRFIQYFSTFLMPTAKQLYKPGDQLTKLLAKLLMLKNNMSLTRKVFRFGGEIPTILNIINRFRTHQTTAVKMIFYSTLNDILNILYLLTDHLLYFIKVGFIKNWTAA